MINFYKENEIGKAAFADGSIYTPQGNVSLLLDATTKQIVIAEDEKVLFYVPMSETLQVDGEEITGTDAEKMALIAPIFQNAGTNTGGGTGGRLGIEDSTGVQDRQIDMANNGLNIVNASVIDLASGDWNNEVNPFGEVRVMPTIINASVTDNTNDPLSATINMNSQEVLISSSNPANNSRILVNPTGVEVKHTINNPDGIPSLAQKTRYVFPNLGQPDGQEVTATVAAIPTQQFANNADAVAALGVGKLYQSATLLDGSPIILITIPE